MRQLHRAAGRIVLDGRGHALIEHHHDVGADDLLRLDAALGAQAKQRVVDVAAEFGVFLAHAAAAGQREDLKAARIGQHRSRPVHEPMDAAELLENLQARPQQQMIGVGEQHLRAALEQIFTPLRPDRGMRAHRHERGRQHLVMPGA